ncbi:MAG TPA: hypothetical protein ENH02_03340 [Bacteroidetes bacterium]|nr:hypothetical protein [Bacteroidota bacterium]
MVIPNSHAPACPDRLKNNHNRVTGILRFAFFIVYFSFFHPSGETPCQRINPVAAGHSVPSGCHKKFNVQYSIFSCNYPISTFPVTTTPACFDRKG